MGLYGQFQVEGEVIISQRRQMENVESVERAEVREPLIRTGGSASTDSSRCMSC